MLGRGRPQVPFNMTTAPFTIALGEADLVSTNTDLHAHLSSAIQLAPTENYISPDDSNVLMKALLNDDDRGKRPWIHRASSFRVELSIIAADSTMTLISEDLIARLASSIREAEVRSLLQHLRWLLIECSCGGN